MLFLTIAITTANITIIITIKSCFIVTVIYSRIVIIFSNDILTFFQLMTANIRRDAIQPEPIFIWGSDFSSAGSPAIEEPASMELLPLPTLNYPVYKIT